MESTVENAQEPRFSFLTEPPFTVGTSLNPYAHVFLGTVRLMRSLYQLGRSQWRCHIFFLTRTPNLRSIANVRKNQEESALSPFWLFTLQTGNSPAQRKQQRLGMFDDDCNDDDKNNNKNSNTKSLNMCQSLLSASHVLFNLILTKTPHNRNCCHIHDRDKKPKD